MSKPYRWIVVAALSFAGALFAGPLSEFAPPGPHVNLSPVDHEGARSFRAGDPLVCTTYFYWYDVYTGSHFRNPDGTDALTRHPARQQMADYSYRSTRWHQTQLAEITEAGIDVVLPVFWGVPGQYEDWSFAGLGPLVEAHDLALAEHEQDPARPKPPGIGLFYDTSTLLHNHFDGEHRHRRIDLTTEFGRTWFYVTIRDFFSMIPPDKWARIDGRPIVFLYGANFAAKLDDALFDDMRKRFRAEFGTDVFLVRHLDWPGRADAMYTWGGALGLAIGEHTAALGPGYDHSAVPGREPLVVDREDGRFYERQWERLLRMNPARRPWLVHVETWNEWHEATDIARSQESGDQYIRITARYASMFRSGRQLERDGPYATAPHVRWAIGRPTGISLSPSRGDGWWEQVEVDGAPAVATVAGPGNHDGRYLYFDVDDSYAYDEDGRAAALTVVFRDDGGCDAFVVEYDSGDPAASVRDGAFRPSRAVAVGDTGVWRQVTVSLPDVRFVNRTNHADFRLAATGGDRRLTVREVMLQRLAGREPAPLKEQADAR